MKASELTYLTPPLPCPFCGGAPRWNNSAESYTFWPDETKRVHRWQAFLKCPGYCPGPYVSGFGDVRRQGGNASALQYAMVEALRIWNRRAPVDAVLHLLHAVQ